MSEVMVHLYVNAACIYFVFLLCFFLYIYFNLEKVKKAPLLDKQMYCMNPFILGFLAMTISLWLDLYGYKSLYVYLK